MPKHCGGTTVRVGDGEGIYLFCFARPRLLPDLSVCGPDDRYAVSQWTFMGITAVFSKASLEEYCGPAAEFKMKDIAWIGSRAFRHEEVVQKVMRRSPVLPARFGTIFLSMDRLENLLKMHASTILQFLDHVAEKEEWSVKGLLDSAKAKEKLYSEITADESERLALLSPGARYFQEKRIQSDIGRELNFRYKKKIQKIAKNLDHYASDSCTRKVLSRAAAGTDMDMVANWAYLVPLKFAKKFRTRVDQANTIHAPDGLTFQLSGPWPPYSFCPPLGIVD
jgi:hypothetical protein